MSERSTLRTLLTLLAGCLLLVVLLVLGAYWRLKHRARQAGDLLVSEARALTTAYERVARPPHLEEPLPGTLAEALGPLVPELNDIYYASQKNKAGNRACADIGKGKRPFAELLNECWEPLEPHRPLLQRALRAARAESGGLPEGWRVLDDREPTKDSVGPDALLSVFELAALDAQRQLAHGQADTALALCLDGLALARDTAYGTGSGGAMTSASGYELLFRPCADALDRATSSGQQRATVALRRIREGLRPLSFALREDAISIAFILFENILGQDQFESLPAGARTLAPHYPDDPPRLPAYLQTLNDWPRHMELYHQLAPIMDLPPDQRPARLPPLVRSVSSIWSPVLRQDLSHGVLPMHGKYATRVDGQRARVDLLLALALVKAHRAEHGTWPTTLPTLYPGREVLLPTALKLQPGEGDTLRLIPEAAGLQELSVTALP